MSLTWIQKRTANALLARAREAVEMVRHGHKYEGRFYHNSFDIFSVSVAIHICSLDRSVTIRCIDSFSLLMYVHQVLEDEGYTVGLVHSLPIAIPDPVWELTVRVPR